jgi:hypothetical protein
MSDTEWTTEGRVEKRRPKKRKPKSHKGKPQEPASGGRMIVDPWTQAILPPGSDENPNVPGI